MRLLLSFFTNLVFNLLSRQDFREIDGGTPRGRTGSGILGLAVLLHCDMHHLGAIGSMLAPKQNLGTWSLWSRLRKRFEVSLRFSARNLGRALSMTHPIALPAPQH